MAEPQHPVITIDGPSGAGKGTISRLLADKLGWHLLDSGAIYRVLGLAATHHDISPEDEETLVPLASSLDVQFVTENEQPKVVLEGEDVSDSIRTETAGLVASKIAALPRVREALLRRQRAFQEQPGLVADGRDMGTVVFPEAEAKLFITASAEERAKRRYLQLKDAGHDASIEQILNDVRARDERDMNRAIAPLVAATDAHEIDTTDMSIEQVLDSVMEFVNQKLSTNADSA